MNLRIPVSAPSKCDLCAIHHRSICGIADTPLQAELSRISHIRTFSAGETVLAESESAGIVGNVVSGVLRMVKTMADGRQQIVGLLLPSDMFGRVFADDSRFAVEAATDVTLCCFERAAFEHLLRHNRDLEHNILLSVLDELDAARDWMVLLGCQTVLERVATFMIILHRRVDNQGCSRVTDRGPPCVALPISRRDMATYLGTTVETISRTIQSMVRKGVIRIVDPRTFEIVKLDALIAMSGREEFRDYDSDPRDRPQPRSEAGRPHLSVLTGKSR
ncbi:MAG: helix-turn-helix domain-containing protein [Mesorhizobium sp.]|nr:helix-turn-helix domain-containing protein [Mesorhizobium sp.]